VAISRENPARGNRVSAAKRGATATARANNLLPVIRAAQTNGASSLRQVADVLNERGIKTARGGEWSAVQVARVLKREKTSA
jgi:hypothetical protein